MSLPSIKCIINIYVYYFSLVKSSQMFASFKGSVQLISWS